MSHYSGGTSSFLVILAVLFFPPLGVFLMLGCGHEVLVAIGLSILGWFPGVFYAMYLYLETGGSNNINATRRVDLARNRYGRSQSGFQSRRVSRRTGAGAAPSDQAGRPVPVKPTICIALANGQAQGQNMSTTTDNAPKLPQRPPMKRTMRDSVLSSKQKIVSAAKVQQQVKPQAATSKPMEATAASAKQDSGAGAVLVVENPSAVAAEAAPIEAESHDASKKDRVSQFLGGIFTTASKKTTPSTLDVPTTTDPGAAIDKTATMPSNRSAQSSPAPGTPGQSAIVNPQITAIRAVKRANVAEGV